MSAGTYVRGSQLIRPSSLRARISAEACGATTLTRAPVVSRTGKEIGHCVDAMAGCSSGRLSYVVVSEGGVAGVGETLRRLPWSGCSADEERVTAGITAADFAKLDQVEPDRWPAR